MKKIINGKLYNTETAKEIGSWWNGYGSSEFNHCAETLYQKNNGEYFMYGRGGALSIYAESHGSDVGWGNCIVPMTDKEARAWAEERLTSDEYLKAFKAEE